MAQSGSGSDRKFTSKSFSFLHNLKRNNRREWFEDHRDEYENHLKAPLIALIEQMDVELATFAPEIIGSVKRSPFRIHRDVRFSRNKEPYKTHVAFWLYHRDAGSGVGGETAHGGAGFYFHLASEGVFCGGGIWMPPRPTLGQLRQALVDNTAGWEEIVLARSFRRRFGDLDPERKLTRVPRGFPPDHPASRWLRFQSFTASCELSREDVLGDELPRILSRHYLALTPFVRWLNVALGLRAAQYR